MRDYKIVTIEEQGVDIDIVNGEPVYLDYESQTGDQRAALSTYAVKGTLPGNLEYGVSWGEVYSGGSSVTELNNEIQLQIQNEAGYTDADGNTVDSTHAGTVLKVNGKVGVVITRG